MAKKAFKRAAMTTLPPCPKPELFRPGVASKASIANAGEQPSEHGSSVTLRPVKINDSLVSWARSGAHAIRPTRRCIASPQLALVLALVLDSVAFMIRRRCRLVWFEKM
jgi:hypothetical protein